MSIHKWMFVVTGAAVVLTSAASPACAQATDVVYRETFGSTISGGDLVSTVFNWQTFNTDGTLRTAVNVNSEDANNPGGWPRDVMNTLSAGEINGGGYGPEGRGWAYLQTGQPLMITQEFSFTPVSGNTQFSWWQLNPNGSRQFRLMVQINNGTWYASAQTFNNTNGGGGLTTWETNSELKSLVYNPAAANWLQMTFNGGFNQASSPMTAGTAGVPATSDLVGNITGFGIWHDQNVPAVGTGNSRFDNFTIENLGPPPVLGDVDGDGDVDMDDFEIIRSNFRKTVTMRNEGDLSGDGFVNFTDFREWKGAFLAGGGSLEGLNLNFLNVPEPAAAVLALLGLAVMASLRPRRRASLRNALQP